MPREFLEIARLSEELRADLQTDREHNPDAESWEAVWSIDQPLRAAISALSNEQLQRLTGWVLFGRDCAGAENPEEELGECITDAFVRDRDAAISYVMGKPIHKYLRKAQETLLLKERS